MQSNSHMIDFLYRRGISQATLDLFNVTIHHHPSIGDCIKIPYSDTHSKYRRDPMSPVKPKYLYDAGGKVTLYGYDVLSRAIQMDTKSVTDFSETQRVVVITEGELDALVLWSQNIPAVSSTGGAMSWQEGWSLGLAPYKVFICLDNDEAGADGTVKILKTIPNASVILIPVRPGVKDISDYVANGGDFRKLMDTALHDLSVETVEEDKHYRDAVGLSTTFHDAYLSDHRQILHRQTHQVSTYQGDDKVLRAKSYPMTNLLEFRQRKACCPFHNEKTPSLHYYPQTNTAYCFGSCGKAYDVISLYQNKHHCTFKMAVQELNKLV